MKKIVLALAAIMASGVVFADVSDSEAIKLRESGTIKDVKVLNDIAVKQYPGTTVESTELDLDNGIYVYDVDLVDANKADFNVKINAATGDVIKKEVD
jgi:uncharacterized membrane protein YkoI